MPWSSDNPPKIRDVAERAGVSTATVSRTLANPDMVTPETRELVLKAVRETGYVPNNAARNLRTARTRTVLAVLPDLTNVFFTRVVRGISDTLTAKGYSLIIADTANRPERESEFAAFVQAGRVDGVLLLNGRLLPGRRSRQATPAVPTVSLCERIPGTSIPHVETDNRAAATALTAHLISLGHRRIAYVGGPKENVLEQDRYAGYLDALAAAGMDPDPALKLNGAFALETGEMAARTLLARRPLPDAIFACADTIAMGLIRGLVAAGIRVPDDVSVAGFDDIDFAEAYNPSLSTVRQDRAAIGSAAARLLLDLMSGKPPAQKCIHIPGEVVLRESTRTKV